MKNKSLKIQTCRILFCLLVFTFGATLISAQSTDQNFPTPIISNEISGTIKARDLGDSRLTVYFYAFDGTQGDIFVNVQTTNFNGDIDIFTVEGLKPISKIVVFADTSDNETGRVIYLRKPEKLLLRIEGRPPNDDPAAFRLKFAGSFSAISDSDKIQSPTEPTVKLTNNSDVRVNSVGTIIEVKPKPTPELTEEVARTEKKPEKAEEIPKIKEEKPESAETKKITGRKKAAPEKKENTDPPKVVVVDNSTIEEKKSEAIVENTPKKKKPQKIAKEKPEEKTDVKKASEKKAVDGKNESQEVDLADALANINLKIMFKDGTKIERPMSEVLKVGVDKGVLTVITKDGKIGRYSILDVAKFAIE